MTMLDVFGERIETFSGDNRFLSNFYPSPIRIELGNEAITFPTAEHLYQASKTASTEDMIKIANAPTPALAKKFGQEVDLAPNWDGIRLAMMTCTIHMKFERSENSKELQAKLIATKDFYLVEGNTWHDNFFGNCTCDKCKNITGKNWLGIILMETRDYYLNRDDRDIVVNLNGEFTNK